MSRCGKVKYGRLFRAWLRYSFSFPSRAVWRTHINNAKYNHDSKDSNNAVEITRAQRKKSAMVVLSLLGTSLLKSAKRGKTNVPLVDFFDEMTRVKSHWCLCLCFSWWEGLKKKSRGNKWRR